jgi:hypothetical protein
MKTTLMCLLVLLSLPIVFANPEQGVAITNIQAMKLLEAKGFSLGDLVSDKNTGIISNNALAQTPSLASVYQSLEAEMMAYKKRNPDIGVGMKFGKRFFDRNFLHNELARFVLVGVINRMDQAYKDDPAFCGETRFIYRLAYAVTDKGSVVSSRLPMTINLIFHAKKKSSTDDCSALASAWKNINIEDREDIIADDLTTNGPLSDRFFSKASAKQLEVNLQIVRWPAAVRGDFGGHAEYLLKVYQFDGQKYVEALMENQIDRSKLNGNPTLLAELKNWIKSQGDSIDKGTFLIPEKFLAKTAFSISPGGINRSGNRPFYNYFSLEEIKDLPYKNYQTIKSPMGFLRRLNDSSCIGCHQTRGIGGFHFTGKDPQGKYPGNSVFLPGSAHFFGDLSRRKIIQEQFINQKAIDYSRGFTARPRIDHAQNIQGTGVYNGWGGHCSKGSDPSFSAWNCAEGLECRSLLDKQDGTGQGVCLPIKRQNIGDPCETGMIVTTSFGVERYTRSALNIQSKDPNFMCSPQSAQPKSSTGGFLNGSIRTKECQNLPPEGVCGPLPAARSGFNSCLGGNNFLKCIKDFSVGVGLRGCDAENPCRDDYICTESYDKNRGACVPPYFLFQFRVDGHPISK